MSFFTRRRRSSLLQRPIPEHWREILLHNVPLVRALPEGRLEGLLRLTSLFLGEKNFEGAGGFEVTDEVRVTVAAQACLLLLGRADDLTNLRVYPQMDSIVVYPGEFLAPLEEHQPDGTVFDGEEERSGESWGLGAVVISWEDAKEGAADPGDGWNVVFHEFAHQLDDEADSSDGALLFPSREAQAEWARVLTREYEQFAERVDRRRRVLLDEYAAESPAEFFAVATEFFFEKPRELRKAHPELYAQMRALYRQNPAEWGPGRTPPQAGKA